MRRTYSELLRLPTFEERFEYLRLDGRLGAPTFGYDRYLNQLLYQSVEWQRFRRDVLIRDYGRDLGIIGREIQKYATVHHITPITIEDIERAAPIVLDFENAITTTDTTHRAIHYGDASLLTILPTARKKGDTCPWRAS